MAKRYGLSDEAWGVVSDLFIEPWSRAAATGRPPDAARPQYAGPSIRRIQGDLSAHAGHIGKIFIDIYER